MNLRITVYFFKRTRIKIQNSMKLNIVVNK